MEDEIIANEASVKPEKETNSLKNSKSPSRRVVIVLLGFFCIIAGLILYIFLGKNSQKSVTLTNTAPVSVSSPTPVHAQWKTYENKKYDYSIAYPGDWSFREFPDTKTGAAFTTSTKPNDYENETIVIKATNKLLTYKDSSFEDYVKTSAGNEIQNYVTLKSIKQVKTESGLMGYQTTWMVQSMMPNQGKTESLPITYFAIPNDTTATIQVVLNSEKDREVYEKMVSTFAISGSVKQTTATTRYLEVPQLGVKIPLVDAIKDSYIVVPSEPEKNLVYLKIHSLDNEPMCLKDEGSTALIRRVGKDEIFEMSNKKYAESYKGVTIGNYFYYINLAQYACAEKPENGPTLESARKAFLNAASLIEKL